MVYHGEFLKADNTLLDHWARLSKSLVQAAIFIMSYYLRVCLLNLAFSEKLVYMLFSDEYISSVCDTILVQKVGISHSLIVFSRSSSFCITN